MLPPLILDIEGVLWAEGAPTAGAPEFLRQLESAGCNYCCLSNQASESRRSYARLLATNGLGMDPARLVTAPVVAARTLAARGVDSIRYLGEDGAREDLLETVMIAAAGPVDAVVVGDCFGYPRYVVDEAVGLVLAGAELFAVQRKALWWRNGEACVDIGFWVAAFEFATNRNALVAGKPSAIAYQVALSVLDAHAGDGVVMVSDEIASDLAGARANGLLTAHLLEEGSQQQPANWPTLTVRSLDELLTRLEEL